MAYTISFLQFYSLDQQDLRHFSYDFESRQYHLLEIKYFKLNVNIFVIYTTKGVSETHCTSISKYSRIYSNRKIML